MIKPKAYSYIRMSTEKQISGDSERRQLQASREYAAELGLELDDTHRDMGVSAFTGENAQTGKLAKFHELVQTGQIAKGSYLIVESLDRLSRQNVLDALPRFLTLINAGIIVVTLADRQVYSEEKIKDSPFQLLGSLIVMIRANEESETKSKRIREAMKRKRDAAMKGESRYNINLPSWIDAIKQPNGDVRYELNEHADTIRLIYELAAEGLGQMEICRILHRRDVPVFRKALNGWHQSTVSHLLNTQTVIGTLQLREFKNGKYHDAGPPQRNYFPAAVETDLYWKAMKAKRARPHRGRKGEKMANLFQGLVVCGVCHGAMTLYHGRDKERNCYLRCYNRMRTHKRYDDQPKQFQCTNGKGINYPKFEQQMLELIPEFKLHEAFQRGQKPADLDAMAARLIDIQYERGEVEKKMLTLVTELSEAPPAARQAYREKISDNAKQLVELDRERDELENLRVNALAQQNSRTDVEAEIAQERAAWASMDQESLFRSRTRVHSAFKRFVSMISFDPDRSEYTVVIGGGIRAFKIRDGKLTAAFDAVESGMINDQPGSLRAEHFATDLRDPGDQAQRIAAVAEIMRNPHKRTVTENPRINDPDVQAIKAKRRAAIKP